MTIAWMCMNACGAQRLLVLLVFATLLLSTGCEQRPRRFAKPPPPDFRRFGALPGLAKSADPDLVDEYARLTSEEATPAQLAAAETPIDVEQGMALVDDLPVRRVESLLEDIAKIYPEGRFEFSSAAHLRARDLLANEAVLIEKAAAQFGGLDERLTVDHCQGLMADFHLVTLAELAHRATALKAQMALTDGDLPAAEEAAVWMLELDQKLAAARHVVPRLKGAQLRLEALRVMEAIAQDQEAQSATLVRFRDLLQAQLDSWPPDADAWIGDRAQGLHTYEMIRHGLVLSVFTDDELIELREEAGVSATAQAIAQDVDADERYYLATMRDVIAACEQPFFERKVLLEKMTRNLQEDRNSPDFPMVAGRILLTDLIGGHRRQAQDRAACEGWFIALCLATAAKTPDFVQNPETGVKYVAQPEETRIVVHHARAGEPDEAIIVPILGPTASLPTRPGISPTTSRAR